MEGRKGYEYSYKFWLDDSVIPEYELMDGFKEEQIQSMFRGAVGLAKQAEAKGVALPITVVVAVDVVTVQQEGESFERAYERAIRADRLIPLGPLWYFRVPGGKFEDLSMTPLFDYDQFLMYLPKKMVEEESGMGCCVCQGKFAVATQFSILPCGHATHPRCVYDWVKWNNFGCPSCSTPFPRTRP